MDDHLEFCFHINIRPPMQDHIYTRISCREGSKVINIYIRKRVEICTGRSLLNRRPPPSNSLVGNGPAEARNDAAVVVVSTKGLPQIKSHVNGEGVAKVAVRNSSLASNAVSAEGDDLGTESVVLSRAELVEDVGGHGNQGHVVGDLAGEVGGEAASTKLVEKVASGSWVSEHEDGAVGVCAGDGCGSSRGGGSQHGGGDGKGELHFDCSEA